MDTLSYTIVDAFTTVPFTGNPAAVIALPPPTALPDALALKIATEFNLSETAFLVLKGTEEGGDSETITYGLRWFTPTAEIVLCGHATLASAKVLFEGPGLIPERVTILRFETLSGILTAKKVSGGEQIELEFPVATLTTVGPEIKARVTEAVNEALGTLVTIRDIRKGGIFLMVHLDETFDMENATVNVTPLLKLADQCIGFIVTSKRPSAVAPNAKFISRMFAPAVGVNEDPVCGSAHCVLAPYWSQLLTIPPGEIIATRQVSPRGGDLDVIWEKANGTVKIRESAVVTARGEMYVR
ncbi:hypothetical protein FRB94_011976 [Tulasnella sp. JGI-2019a]|nr:hypothetical protein FRB94_011976 [Tulasnella sp. JGI-2019a]